MLLAAQTFSSDRSYISLEEKPRPLGPCIASMPMLMASHSHIHCVSTGTTNGRCEFTLLSKLLCQRYRLRLHPWRCFLWTGLYSHSLHISHSSPFASTYISTPGCVVPDLLSILFWVPDKLTRSFSIAIRPNVLKLWAISPPSRR